MHKLTVALICCAVAIPFTYIIAEAYAKAGEPEFPEQQLTWPLQYRLMRWKERWDWANSRPGKARFPP